MKLGLSVVAFNWPGYPENIGEKLAQIGRAADKAGFDSLWVMDHFFQMDGPRLGVNSDEPMLESYSSLGYLAAVTSRIRLGTMVTGVNYRHAGHLLKIVTSLDVLSRGRAIFGIGAGWYEREALGLGFPFPPTKQRFEQLEEVLQIFKQVWSGDFSAYQGKHYQLAEPINNPQPLTKPHPPILVGGGGEKKTLRLAAKYAEACNLIAFMGNDELARKLEVLKSHCKDLGRDYDEIEKTVFGKIEFGSDGRAVPEVIARCKELAEIGFDEFIFAMPSSYKIRPIEIIGEEVIPAVAGF